MKILILASGGDAPGMNKFISMLYKKFGSNLYACRAGFEGLFKNDILPMKFYNPIKFENSAGCCIKTSRFPDFKKPEIFKEALNNAKKFDYLIVLGGNGSHKGVRELSYNGVKTIFVPATIDNDVEENEYSIGFHTAVSMVCYAFRSIMPSMESQSRTCIFETMGRYSGNIATNSSKILKPDFLICDKKDFDVESVVSKIKNNVAKDKSTSIILRENIFDVKKLASQIQKEIETPNSVKFFIVGHLQRGGKPTKTELRYSKMFAKATIKAIKSNLLTSASILFNSGKPILYKI